MDYAVNPDTGEVVFLVGNKWVPPTDTAVNDAGQKAYLVGNAWQVPNIPTPKKDSGVGTTAADVGKLVAAGATTATADVPKGIETIAGGLARETGFKPQDVLEYLADPAKITNKLGELIGVRDVLEEKKNLVPQKTRMAQEIAVDEALTQGKIQSLEKISQAGKELSKSIEGTVSPEMRQAMAASTPEGNIIKSLDNALVTGDFSGVSFGKDVSGKGILGLGAKVLGSSLPALLGGVTARSEIVGGALGGGAAASEAKDTAKEHISKLDDLELFKASPYFQELLAQGVDREKARALTIEKAGDVAGMYQGLTAALGSAFTTKLVMGEINKKVINSVKDRIYNVLEKGITGTAEESAQELMEGVAADLGINKTVVREIGTDSFANLVLGALGGAGPGTVGGLRGEAKAAAPAPKFETTAEGKVVPTTEAAPAAPLEQLKQAELFTPEEAPYQVTPGDTTAVERSQAEIQRQIDALSQQEPTPEVTAQIEQLKSQLPQDPKQRAIDLGEEMMTLERKYKELETQRDATKSLKDKAPLSEQMNTIRTRQNEILAEGKQLQKQGVSFEAPAEQAALELEVPSVIDDKVAQRFGFTKKATKIVEAIRGLDMTKPEDREKFRNEIAKHERKGAKVDPQAAEEYVSYFEEAPSGDIRTGPDSGTSQPSVSVPSGPEQTAEGLAAPVAEGVGSPVGIAGGPVGGAGVSGEAGNVALEPAAVTPPATVEEAVAQAEAPAVAQEVTPAIDEMAAPAPEPEPAPQAATQEGIEAASLFQAAGGTRRAKPSSKFVKTMQQWKTAYDNNMLLPTMFGKFQNAFSFDRAFSNRMRNIMFSMAGKGDITMEQAKTALLRLSISQALYRSDFARRFMAYGDYTYNALENRWYAVKDQVNMDKFEDLAKALAKRLGVDPNIALEFMSKAYEANRVKGFYDDLANTRAEITRTEKKVDLLSKNRKRTKGEQKDLDTKKALLTKLKENEAELVAKVQHMDRAQMQKGIELYNKYPEIKQGTEIWNTMRERTIKMLVEAGVKTEEQAKKWLDESAYVPFFRDVAEEKLSGPQVMTRGIREAMADQRMKGSMLEVENTVGNMYQWMQWSVARAISNKQLTVMLDQYKSVLPDEVREGRGPADSTFSVFEDGVQKFYHVADPAIAQAFAGMESVIFPGIGALMRFKNAFSHIITRIPVFPVAQLILMDTWSAMHTSGAKHPFGIVKNIAKEMYKTATGTSEAREKMTSAGVLATHDYAALTDADDVAMRLDLQNPSVFRRTMNMLDKWAALNDNLLRQAVYQQLKDEGNSDAVAMERAVEIVNFRRSSGNAALVFASRITPFFNAYAQVLDVSLRTVTGKGISPQERKAGLATLASTAAKLGILSFLYAAAMDDDEEYKKKSRITRDRVFMIPGTSFSIPLRYDFFLLPKIIGEYGYHHIMNTGFVDSKMAKDAMKRAVMKQFEPPLTNIVTPAVGLATNHDFFFDREIVNATMRKLDPEKQYSKSTSELAKVLGEAGGMSPAKIDYALNAYSGSFMTLVAVATNDIIAKARGVPRPERSTKDIIASLPSMGGFISKDETSSGVADYYEAAREVNQTVDTYRNIAKSDREGARKYIKEPDRAKQAKVYEAVSGVGNALEGLKRKENMILESRTMSPAEKRAELDKIQADREKLQKPIREIRKGLGY